VFVFILPMIPELVVKQALGFVPELSYSLGYFAGFSASAVSARINDCECKMVVTSDGGYRGNKKH